MVQTLHLWGVAAPGYVLLVENYYYYYYRTQQTDAEISEKEMIN